MLTDYHIHILPGIDDGSQSTEMSFKMAQQLKKQGVKRIVATPHFYCHREKSVERFLEKRKNALDEMLTYDFPIQDIKLGAEVSIEHGLNEVKDIQKLAIEGTDIILLEFPYAPFQKWYIEEIRSIASEHKLKIMLAHIHRYLQFFTKDELNSVLELDAVFQVNNEAFESFFEKRFVNKLIKNDYPVIFGSDSHRDSGERFPNWDVLQKKVKPDIITNAMESFEKNYFK